MKEQYMEQTRTLEQLQLQMKQQLQDKQAQLMQQITSMDLQQGSAAGNSQVILSSPAVAPRLAPSDAPPLNSTPNNSSRSPYINNLTSQISNGSVAAVPQVKPTNGFTPLCNGSEVVHQSAAMTSSFSADESNTSQGSSHDTWDSTNAFTHERPVLTGSERSTPTPILPSNDDSSLELLSQSIHIPLDNKDNQTLPPNTTTSSELLKLQGNPAADTSLINPKLASIKSVDDLIDLNSHASDTVAADDSTPRNAVTITADATAAATEAVSVRVILTYSLHIKLLCIF